MKTYTRFFVSIIVIFLILQFLISCNISHQNDIACPDFKIESHKKWRNSNQFGLFTDLYENKKLNKDIISRIALKVKKDNSDIGTSFAFSSDFLTRKNIMVVPEKLCIPSIHDFYTNGTINETYSRKNLKIKSIHKFSSKRKEIFKPDSLCDTIILKNGELILVSEIIIRGDSIKFKKCHDETKSNFIINRDTVINVKFHNWQINQVAKDKEYTGELKNKRKFEILGIISVVAIIFGFYTVIGFPIGIVLGFISLNKIKQNPEKYKGKGFALASIITGIAALLYLVILLFIFFVLLLKM